VQGDSHHRMQHIVHARIDRGAFDAWWSGVDVVTAAGARQSRQSRQEHCTALSVNLAEQAPDLPVPSLYWHVTGKANSASTPATTCTMTGLGTVTVQLLATSMSRKT